MEYILQKSLTCLDYIFIPNYPAGPDGPEQYQKCQERHPLLQPCAKSGQSDHNGAAQVTLYQEQVSLPQGQDPES